MVVDGMSRVVSEISGLGFRESNGWLAALTGNAFSELFYASTTSGSLNWWMRTLTGALLGVAVVWFAYPHLEKAFHDVVRLGGIKPERTSIEQSTCTSSRLQLCESRRSRI
jgi:hypothetical protein